MPIVLLLLDRLGVEHYLLVDLRANRTPLLLQIIYRPAGSGEVVEDRAPRLPHGGELIDQLGRKQCPDQADDRRA